MRKRKPILLVDDSPASKRILDLFTDNRIEFVKYDIRNFEVSCCGELPTTRAPSVIAMEGIFKGESLSSSYVDYAKHKKGSDKFEKTQRPLEEDSSYW